MTIATRLFSEREVEILLRLAAGDTQAQAAYSLHISPHTVKSHMARMQAKADALSSAHLVAIAFRRGELT